MKKVKIIGVIIIFLLSIISHFGYNLLPNTITSILFPVNESIWEHMKLLATPVLIFAVIEYFCYKKRGINYHNFILSYAISIILGILIYLTLYLPINAIIGHKAFIAISLLFIVFIIIEFISYLIMNSPKIKYNKLIGIILILFIYSLFYYFTYYPKNNDLFFDSQKNIYGIEEKDL